MSEHAAQNTLRVTYAEQGYQLFRNNVGVLRDDRGIPVRFGLANDSKAANRVYKSGDLIGWETITITPEMVGQRLAVFVSVEVKPEGWAPAPPPSPGAKGERWHHEEAQRRWRQMVRDAGGKGILRIGAE